MVRSPRVTIAGLLLLASAFVCPVRAAEPFRYPEAKYGTGELRYVNGLPVLTVSGTPEEIGQAVGALAVRPGQRMLDYPEDLLTHFHLHFLWGTFARAGNRMVARFPADYRRELEALVESSNVERDRLVVGNTLFDLKKVLACSALLVEPERSATGAPLLGRNLDYPSLGYAHEHSLVTVYRPEGKHAFASVGFPGLVGCLSGMNDMGLSLAILEVFQVKAGQRRFDSTGIPYALCYRQLLEECATIAEAKTLLESMPRTTTTNLVIADRDGVAVLEVTPRHVVLRGPQQGACVCTNHFCTDELRPLVRLSPARSLERFATLEAAVAKPGKFGPSDVQHSLDAVRMNEETMQTMIFEPCGLRMHLSIGTCPSSAGEMRALELAPLFAGARISGK
jgi:isopenicillin-N N-acyltransferase-like protein